MAGRGPLRGIQAWFVHRLVANYWSLPLAAVLAAPVVGASTLWADSAGAGDWLFENGLAILPTADAAQDVAAAIVGVNAAFLTLYWSVTLIVLTLATGNLGVRLVDRWLDKGLVRLSMAGLTFCLVFAVIVMLRIDADARPSQIPHFAMLALFALSLVNIAMLGVAIHDLGRTMFVDRSIAHLGAEAARIAIPIRPTRPHTGPWNHEVPASRSGYVEGIDLETLRSELALHQGAVRFCAAPGQHVLKGEALVRFDAPPPDERAILRAIPIGEYRSGMQSTVYQVRLLVEVAARALSPGINDFYTAIACADQLSTAIAGQADLWVDEGMVAAYEPMPQFELPGQDFLGLFGDPLKSFRQAAAAYPSVSIRMIDNFARLIPLLEKRGCARGLTAYLAEQAQALRDHAAERAEFDNDRQDILRAYDRFEKAAQSKENAA